MATRRVRKREQAIAALMSCRTVKAAAEQCGMNYTTLLLWLRSDEEFKAMYAAEKKTLLDGVKASLLQSAISGSQIIQDALDDETESPLARLPVAKFAIESAMNIEISDAVLSRIEESDSKPKGWDSIIPTSDDNSEEVDGR